MNSRTAGPEAPWQSVPTSVAAVTVTPAVMYALIWALDHRQPTWEAAPALAVWALLVFFIYLPAGRTHRFGLSIVGVVGLSLVAAHYRYSGTLTDLLMFAAFWTIADLLTHPGEQKSRNNEFVSAVIVIVAVTLILFLVPLVIRY